MACINRYRYPVLLIIILTANCIVYMLIKNKSYASGKRKLVTGSLHSDSCRPLCVSAECILTANNIAEYADFNVDPCDNFYDYSCKSYMRTWYPLHDTYMINTPGNNMQMAIRKMVETPGTSTMLQTIKTMYRHCLDHDANYKETLDDYREILSQLGMKDWPWLNENFAFPNGLDRAISSCKSLDCSTFISINLRNTGVCARMTDSSNDEICVSMYPATPASFKRFLPYIERDNQQMIEEYREVILKILTFFDVPKLDALKYADEMLQFEFQMYDLLEYEHSNSTEDITVNHYHRYIVSDSNWADIIRFFLENEGVTTDISNLRLHVIEKNYIESLKVLIDGTSHRIVANYMAIALILCNLDHFGLSLTSYVVNNGVTKWLIHRSDDNIQQYCLNILQYELRPLVIPELVELYFDAAAIDSISNVHYSLTNITYKVIDEMTYIDNETNKMLKKAVQAMPIMIEKNEYSAEVYKEFSLKHKSFFYNIIEWNIYERTLRTKVLLREIKPLYVSPLDLTCSTMKENIYVDLAMLMFPAFTPGRPQALNVANVGTFFAREIVYMIDRRVGLCDPVYVLYNPGRMGGLRHRYEEFEAAMYCLIDKYNGYTIGPNEIVDGERTFYDNFANLLGVQIGFRAYVELVKKHGTIHLPGVNLTSNQLYFLSYAENFCTVFDDTFKTPTKIQNYTYSKINYEVLGTLSELEAFSKVYSCSANSPMNDSKNCQFNTWIV